jgi:hypothetical protein
MSTRRLAALVIAITFAPILGLAQGSVSLDHVDGLTGDNKLNAGAALAFHLRLTNTGSYAIAGSTNGIRVYSPDGAQWEPVVGDTANLGWGELFDGGVFFTPRGVDGLNDDTLGFAGFVISGTGLPAGFNAPAFIVRTRVESDYLGQTLCIDSCYYPPAGYWYWSYSTHGTAVPGWDGPHCFEIGGCYQIVGDINHSGSGPDISDLVYLVTYMFQSGPAPSCMEPNGGEANINGDSAGPDISDLVYLVTYMFQSGPAPVACP